MPCWSINNPSQPPQLSYHYPAQSSFKRHQSTQPKPSASDTNAPHTARGDGGRPPEDFKKLSSLPPGRRQRLHTARLTRRIQRLDSCTISLFVRMIVKLGHRHRLMAGEVVDLLDGDAEERLLRIDFFPVVADSVEEEIKGHILGEHWGLEMGDISTTRQLDSWGKIKAE